MARGSADDFFNVEVLKVMLQLAQSDGRVDPREAGVILGAARSWGVPESELAALKKGLEDGSPPPAPDLTLLRGRSDEVLAAVQAVIVSDGKLSAEERDMLAELRLILEPA